MAARPVSWPTARAPLRQNLTPLYCAGLCDAVNIAPGASRLPGGEVDEVGRGQTEIDDVDALLVDTTNERLDEFRARRAHVATDEHSRGVDKPGKGDAEGVGDVDVELLGDGAPYVIRLDDDVEQLRIGR